MMMQHTRRQFVGGALAAGASVFGMTAADGVRRAAWAAAAETTGKPGAKIRLGLVTYLWGQDWDLPTLLTNCQKAKIGGVELRVQHKHGVEPTLSAEQRAEAKKRFADSGIVFVGPGTNEAFDYVEPEKVKRAIENTKAYVKLSHDCGGSGVKVRPNDLREKEGVPREKTIAQIGNALNEVGRFAADYGQQIRLEVHGSAGPLPIIKQIMDVAVHPNVGVCWNCNGDELKPPGLEHHFNLVKDRFGATCHVRELNLGDYPYQELIKLLVRMDYDGWVLLECRTKPTDRVAALIEQREVFERMVRQAQA